MKPVDLRQNHHQSRNPSDEEYNLPYNKNLHLVKVRVKSQTLGDLETGSSFSIPRELRVLTTVSILSQRGFLAYKA